MREPQKERARERRELAALIRWYAGGLEPQDRRDLLAHADSIDAEASALDEATDAPETDTYESLKASTDALFQALLVGLRAVDDSLPDVEWGTLPQHEAFRATARIAHIAGTPEARYQVRTQHSVLQLHVEVNVYRLIVVYRVPTSRSLDSGALQARLTRWAMGIADTGWSIAWRDGSDDERRCVEVCCKAALPIDFLQDERHQLYWITEVVRMTRAFLLEARRAGIELTAASMGNEPPRSNT